MTAFQMDFVTKNLVVFAISLLILNWIYKWIRSRNYPPGPYGLPVLGYGFFFGKKPHVTLQQFGEKYDGIFSFYTGPQLVICVTEYHMIKDILSLPNTLDRPPHSFDFLIGKAGLGTLTGEKWREQRRFAMHTLRKLGHGKGLWETLIQENAINFVNELKKMNGKTQFYGEILTTSQIKNNLSLLFGRHLDPEDEKQQIELVLVFGREMIKQVTSTNINIILPWLFKILKHLNFRGIKDFMDLSRKVGGFIENEVKRRSKNFKNESKKEDFISFFIQEMEKTKDNMDSSFTVENLNGNLFLFLIAGLDSSVGSVGWLLLLMASYSDIQKRVHEEIDREIGRDGTVYHEHKIKLPYTFACIQEMLRWVSINGILPPRYVTEGFTFHNYEIPKGAQILCNAYAMQHDPRYFKDPMKYEPERFIDSDGTVRLNNVDAFGPFSFGKRKCPGEGVAMMTVFLYFATIMQNFSVTPPLGKVPNMDYVFSMSAIPIPQELCFVER